MFGGNQQYRRGILLQVDAAVESCWVFAVLGGVYSGNILANSGFSIRKGIWSAEGRIHLTNHRTKEKI